MFGGSNELLEAARQAAIRAQAKRQAQEAADQVTTHALADTGLMSNSDCPVPSSTLQPPTILIGCHKLKECHFKV